MVGRPHSLDKGTIKHLGGLVKGFLSKSGAVTVRVIRTFIRDQFTNDPDLKAVLIRRRRAGKAPLRMTMSWVRSLMKKHWNLAWRKGTQAARKLPDDYKEQGELFKLRAAYQISTLPQECSTYNQLPPEYRVIPKELVVNADQSSMNLITIPKCTWAGKGDKQVKILGMDDKRCITGVVGSAASGELLPLQIIFTGLTSRVLPNARYLADARKAGFHFTFSSNHWSSQKTMKEYIDCILVPYFKKVSKFACWV
jgi:hypothetical protein